jgi:hypothetical protein
MLKQVFGQLTVISQAPTRYFRRSERPNGLGKPVQFWVVQCSCGSKPFERSERLIKIGTGYCQSCSRTLKNPARTHNESDAMARGKRRAGSPEYRIWKAMKTRCYNPKYKQFKDYGGRGIKVCERWLESYENFLADMGRRPTSKHSIERRKNDENYSPDNCYWATSHEQRRNRRTTVLVEINGRTQCVTDWMKELNVSKSTYCWRKRKGWSNEEALLGRSHG